ncbi:hypothetical protein [uncultured Aliivibrio sp.]|uniref:hypothetical protein n=1 Tax=uncultured Aliivibrio sp. TaxID=873085 RepID=UPI002608CC27|nr:hypothetical protein [uncultured Aliivibrio sp.]
MIKNQQGAITLLVSSAILMASLIISLGSYKHIFYQIKRAQNEMEARKGYWAAEGGVECVYAKVTVLGEIPSGDIDECQSLFLTSLTIVKNTNYQIEAVKTAQIVKKTFIMGGIGGDGVIKSSSNLYFYSSISIDVPDPVRLGSNGWECVAVRYKSLIDAYGSVVNQEQDCSSTHRTNTSMGSLGFKSDFKKDIAISPFKDVFGVEPSDHNLIRDNGKFDVLHGSGSSNEKRLVDCGTRIKNSLNLDNKYIWVEGSCEISSDEYQGLAEAMNNLAGGAFIIVHDGSLSIMGAPIDVVAKEMKGIIFHFNHEYIVSSDGSNWSGTDAYNELYPHNGVANPLFPSYFLSTASFYQHGAFTLKGGQFFDTQDQSSIFYTSASFKYNEDIIQNLISGLVQPRWKAGSWHDF